MSAAPPPGQNFRARPDSGGWSPPPVHQAQAGQRDAGWAQPVSGPGYAPGAGAAEAPAPVPPYAPQPVPPQPVQSQPAVFQPAASQLWPAGDRSAGHARQSGGRGLSLAAGIAALAGAGLVIWACALPDIRYITGGTSAATSYSIFHSGSQNGLWYAAEPVGVSVVVVVAALLLMTIARASAPRWVMSGLLAGFGIQTALLFAGYQYGIYGTGVHAGSAGTTGIVGGIVLLVAGLIGMFSAAGSRPDLSR